MIGTYLTIDDLVDRGVYEIHSRNLAVGVYRESTNGFIGIRQKFDSRYLFEEHLWGSGPYGTVRPKRLLEMLPDHIRVSTSGKPATLCSEHGREAHFKNHAPEGQPVKGKWYHTDDDSLLAPDDWPHGTSNPELQEYLEPLDEASRGRDNQ